jgi:hypothetical protein
MTLTSNFLSPSTDPLNDDVKKKANFIGVQGFYNKLFNLLDEQTVSIDIILYAGKVENGDIDQENNGIAIAISKGDLIADKLLSIENSADGASKDQVALFEKLIQIEDYPTFSDTVNNLATSLGRLRTEL